MSTETQEFLSPAIVARVLGISTAAVRAASMDGRLRVAARTVDGRRLYVLDDVKAWAATRARRRRRRAAAASMVVDAFVTKHAIPAKRAAGSI